MSIPPTVHFCWVGPRLSWAYVFAVLSARQNAQVSEVILHHTDVLEDCASVRALIATPGVTLQPLDPTALLSAVGDRVGIGDALCRLYERLVRPVMRVDILRSAILFQQGGIYLDLDTITVGSLLPLLDAKHFVGCEYIVWPQAVRSSKSPTLWAKSLALDLLRKILRKMPSGWKYFRRVEKLYYRAVNNAVLGAEPNSPFFGDYLRAMASVPFESLKGPYALGPDLLQHLVAQKTYGDLVVHDPETFYPLPPEISEHWFRMGTKPDLSRVLSPQTRIVHWYASVRTRSGAAEITPDYVKSHWTQQLYSALVVACLPYLF